MKDCSCHILYNFCQTTETDTTTTSATLTKAGLKELVFFGFGAVVTRHVKDCSCRILYTI